MTGQRKRCRASSLREHRVRRIDPAAIERHRLRAAAMFAVVLTLVTAAAFLKERLTVSGYEIRGEFTSANRLRVGSDVRIAGVKVGEVRGIERASDRTAIVRLRLDDTARPVHADATLAIRPRLILEGNFYVDLRPGTPAAPELAPGGRVPVSHTSVPVQADQVLSTFDLAARGALHGTIGELADGLGRAPGAPRSAPGGVRGARRTVRALEASLDDFGVAARAARGTRPADLPRAITGTADLTGALARDPRALAGFVANTSRVMGALAAQDTELAATVRGFDAVLRAAPEPLRKLDGALPVLTRFAGDVRPAVRAVPGAVGDAHRFLRQLDGLVAARELPALLGRLRPVTAVAPRLERRLGALAERVTPISTCLSKTVVPALDQTLPDGANSTGDPAWLDILHAFTGVVGFTSAFDGNGVATRTGVTQGEGTLTGVSPLTGQLAAIDGPPVRGVRPVWLGYGKDPAYDPGAPCAAQQLPDMRARSGPPPAWMRGGR